MIVLAVMVVVGGCSKNLPDGNGHSGGGTDIIDEPLEELPPLDDVDDVCEKMLDLNFMSYCYRKFDVNADGRVSMAEANAVRTIECDSAENFSGIEYFSSLETFKSSSVQTIDLRYNKKLLSVDCKGAPIAAVDLRYNTGLQEMSFEDCTNFVKVLLPSELDYIGRGAFRNTAIVRFVCPDSVKTIGGSAFNGCKSLESVAFPEEGLREIGDSAFISCSALESVTFPEGLQEIGSEAFSSCYALESVTFPEEGLREIGDGAFKGCYALESVTFPEGLREIRYRAFKSCPALKSVTFPEGLQEIGSEAFSECSALESVTFPEGLREIVDRAFGGCSALESVTFPEGLREIGYCAFISCSALESITFPEGLQEIGSEAFRNCFALESVTLPSSTELIGKKAFRESPLTKVVCHASNPPEQNESFDDVPVLYVPSSSVDAYKQSNWTFCFEQILPIE